MLSLLIVLMPALAALATFVAGGRPETVRRIAAAGIGAQLVLAVAVLVRFPLDDIRAASAAGLSPHPVETLFVPLGTLDAASVFFSFSFSFGLDSFSLPFLFLVPLLFGAVLLCSGVAFSRYSGALILLLEAFLTGAFVSLDGLGWVMCAGAFLVGGASLPFLPGGKRDGARRYLPAAFGGLVLLCVGLTAVSSETAVQGTVGEYRARTFALPALGEMAAANFRADLAADAGTGEALPSDTADRILFLLLLGLCGGLMAVVPLHSPAHALADALPRSLSPFLFFLFPLLGLLLLVRFPLSLFPEFGSEAWLRTLLAAAGGITALYAGLVAAGERKRERLLRYVVAALSGTALVRLASFDAGNIGLGLFLLVVGTVCAGGLHVLGCRIERGLTDEEIERTRGLLRAAPRWSLLFGAVAVPLVLLPLYPGIRLIGEMVAAAPTPEPGGFGTAGTGWMVAVLIGCGAASVAVAKTAARLLFGESPVEVGLPKPVDLHPGEFGAGAALLLGLALLAVALLPLCGLAGESIRQLVTLTVSVPT